MSKLAELLQSQRVPPATPATVATQEAESSKSSDRSRGHTSKLGFSEEIEQRIRRMAERWQYSPDELAKALQAAAADPERWECGVDLDERREAEFRALGLLPKEAT